MIPYLQAYQKIVQALSSKVPFALIRIGDGEGFFLNRNIDGISHLIEKQFGLRLQGCDWELIRDNLIQACCQADLIGIPTQKHVDINSGWNHARSFVYELGSQFCSIDIHIDLLKNNYLDSLIKEQEEIFIISGRQEVAKSFLARYENLKNINQFIITPELKFESNKSQESHFPNQYNKIKKWISELDCSGKLCLVGAGVAGKIYNIWFKRRGGISLDLGCVFDLWAGKVTRGPNRGVGVEDNTYRL